MLCRRNEVEQVSLQFVVEPNAGNHLAWMNAVFGLQRTLMAAERTAITLIAFGFTVAQVFQNMKTIMPARFAVLGPHLPRDVGLMMIAGGVGSLALFTWQYLRAIAHLEAEPFVAVCVPMRTPLHQLTCSTAYAIMILGLLGFVSVFLSY